MDISKVVYGDTTLIDLTEDTVTADSMLSGVTAHGANGEQIYGTMSQVTPATATPLMDGTAAVGTSIKYAREDHVHPHDSSIPTKTSDLTNDSGFITSYIETDPIFSASPAAGITSADISGWNAKGTYSKPSGGIPASDLANTYAGAAVAGGIANGAQAIPYGEVDSTSTSTAYTATVSGITELKDGTCVMLKNGVVTSASGFTIDINGLGAKPVYSSMATGNDITPTAPTRETTIFNINYTLLLIYSTDLVDGGAWINYRGYNSDTNTIGYQLRTNSTIMKTADASRYYRIFFTSADGTHWVPANTAKDNSATSKKTVNQRKINPFGMIMYYGAATNLSAEADVVAAYCWSQYTFAFGYSFNTTGSALTLTTKTPVYIKCAPQTDGSAIIDSTTPYVQALPSAADGKIYIFLGIAYSATNIELYSSHPVYFHDGTSIKLWTGKAIPTKTSELTNDSGFITAANVPHDSTKQDLLVSGTNIKTLNGQSLLGSGNIALSNDGTDRNFNLEAYGRGEFGVPFDPAVSEQFSSFFDSFIQYADNEEYYELVDILESFVDLDQQTIGETFALVLNLLPFILEINKPPVTSVNGRTGAVVVPELPSVTSSDNGKVLRVVNGVWTAVQLPSASGVSF